MNKERIIAFVKKNGVFIIGFLIGINLLYFLFTDNGETEIQKTIIEAVEKSQPYEKDKKKITYQNTILAN